MNKSGFLKKSMQNLIILAALIVLVVIFTLLNPNFLNSYNIVSMAQSLAPYAIMALGVTFVIATGGIDLSIGTNCIACAVIAGKMFTDNIIPLWAVIPIMIIIGTLIGLINGVLVAKLKLPAFIATLGTMMFARGLSALIVSDPNIFYPNGVWFNSAFSNANGIPTGIFWVIGFWAICMYLMYKCKIGRYILSIGSNEEATRLSGVNTDTYKMLAYIICGMFSGIAAIFWAASFTTVATATGNGMELDAIAGVYIGGTSAAGGVASISGSVIGSLMLVVIRSGLNFVLARFELNVNSTYVTYVLTGIIVVLAVLMDVLKNKKKNSQAKKGGKLAKRLTVIISCVLAVSLITGLVCCSIGNKGNQKTVAVIAKGEAHAFWQSVKSGAEAAGEKYGYKITFRGPASESTKDLPSQKEMVQTALSNNSSAIVLGTIGEGFVDMLEQAYDSKIPVVQFDSGVWENDIKALDAAGKNPIISSVATSNRDASALDAEKFYAAIKDDIAKSDKYVVGIIQHDETQTGTDRAEGFIDKFTELANSDATTKGKYTIEKEVKPGDADNAYKTALEALYEKGAKAIFMTNEGVVKQVYDAIGAAGTKYNKIVFCGYDAGSKQIEWMKKDGEPRLIGSVAQDSYQIGYQAVEQAINAIEGKTVTPKVDISGVWWDKTNVDEMITKNLVYQG